MEFAGLLSYAVFFVTLAGIYGLMTLGLNIQWGGAGMLNIGIAGFFATGAYTAALLTAPATAGGMAGLGLPFPLALAIAAVVSGILAALIGLLTLNLRSDYLAISSIGIAEIVRLVLKNEAWLTNGVRGLGGIPNPVAGLVPGADRLVYMIMVLVLLVLVYWMLERAWRSPWGRTLRAIRDDETAARAMGKNALGFRLEAFVLGSAIMGLAGGLYAHFARFISPEAFDPVFATFIVWVMLIAGGSGNNRGAILGAFAIWAVWAGSEVLTNRLPPELVSQAGAVRVLLIGVMLLAILMIRPGGILPERPPPSIDRR